MEDEEEVRRVAADYVAQYGRDAPAYLWKEAHRARLKGDDSAVAWIDLAQAAEEILATRRQ